MLPRGEALAGWLSAESQPARRLHCPNTEGVSASDLHLYSATGLSGGCRGVIMLRLPVKMTCMLTSVGELCLSCKYMRLVSTYEEWSWLSSNPLSSCKVTCGVRAAGEGLCEPCSGLGDAHCYQPRTSLAGRAACVPAAISLGRLQRMAVL